ncbi:MAG: hypothetical protein J1E05_03120 [Eubacterium sp.]|nr:hypothetical protein [Eubacterium sp.]
MRKLRPILAVIVALSILLLSGCADIQALFSNTDSDFYEIKAISDKAEIYNSIDISGDNILLLTASGIENYKLTVYDAKNNKITAEVILNDCPLDFIAGAKFKSENEIIVYDDGNDDAVIYDLALNQTGTTEYVNTDNYDSAPESGLLNDSFSFYDTYAYFNQGDNCYFLFYDDPESVYVFDGTDETIYCADGKNLFTEEVTYSKENDSSSATVYVKDVESGLCVNKMELEDIPGDLFNNILASAISDKYVCFANHVSNNNTGGSETALYLWKYAESPTNEKIEIKSMTESELLEDNERMISELHGTYGINVYPNKKPITGYDVELGVPPIRINNALTQLSACLALFPENFIQEIYKDAEYVNNFNIYIVDYIDGATAFAIDFLEDYEICFDSRGGFSKTVVFHELMHLIDNRIITYYEENGKDFISEWKKLNPADFEYGSEVDYDNPEEHFVSFYAMTTIDEDLADTFQTMYEAYIFEGDHRLKDYEHVKKKAVLLCEAIREAFPSMANADEVCWEKYIDLSK